MNVKYSRETGLMYIYFATGIPNLQVPTDQEGVSKFVAKSDRKQIVGYEIENTKENIMHVLHHLGLSRKQSFAVAMCFIRENERKTQKEFSLSLEVGESTYKSIERAEHNVTFDVIDGILVRLDNQKILHSIF